MISWVVYVSISRNRKWLAIMYRTMYGSSRDPEIKVVGKKRATLEQAARELRIGGRQLLHVGTTLAHI
jgi:hypothetical protein